MAVETVGGVMSLSPIIGVVEQAVMAGAMAGGVMSPSPIIGVEDQKTSIQMTSIQIQILSLSLVVAVEMVGGVMSLSPIIGVVERPAMAGGVMCPSPIIGVEDQKTSIIIQMTSIQIQILSLSTVGGVMSPSPIIGVVEPQKYPKVVNRVRELERKGEEKERTEAQRK